MMIIAKNNPIRNIWKEKPTIRTTVGECFQFIKTYSISREGLDTDPNRKEPYCIHYGDIHSHYEKPHLNFNTQSGIPKIGLPGFKFDSSSLLLEGDLILADASEDYEGVGEVVEVINLGARQAFGGLHTIVLRDIKKLTAPGYRGYLFSCEEVRNELRRLATGTSVYSISKSSLSGLQLFLPSYEEQIAIAQVLQTADREINFLRAKEQVLLKQRKGLMQSLLSGKRRLREFRT